MLTAEQLAEARALVEGFDGDEQEWLEAALPMLGRALDDVDALRADRDSARSALAALIAESARIALQSGQALEHAAQAMERCVAERDAARVECERLRGWLDDRIKWQVSAVAHLTVWRRLFDAAMEMREGHEGCVTDPACGDCFRCRFDRAVDEALIAVSADSFGFIDASDLRADLTRAQAVVDAAVCWQAHRWKADEVLTADYLYDAVIEYLAVQPGDGGGELLAATDPSPAELTAEVERLRAEVARMHPTYDAAKALCVEWFDTSGSMSQIDAIQDRAREVAMAAFAAIAQEQNVKPVDDESRCAACQRPLAASVRQGCVRGNCAQRPLPTNYYAPERYAREEAAMVRGVPHKERNRG